ncbi:MAG: hypothetical protein HY731_12845 [Candidatus Tectomicrobia bacterium]|nr:hypothetical protein [Candidatus Tectomicrobia bacterium]
MTDGLPIIPPTEELVTAMLQYTDRDPDEEIGKIAPKFFPATLAKIAVNAVMAGCLPEYFPIVLTALEAMVEERFNLYAVQATTHPCAPLVIVNGPLARELEINSGYNVFGQGWRANATIGRAIRFALMNIGGGIPGKGDKATQGHPGKFTFCIAENEVRTPWEPLHVERGFDSEISTVTVTSGEAPHNINDHGSTSALGILTTVAGTMAIVGSNNAGGGGEPLLVFGPEHAETVARDGFSKKDVKEFLFEHARNPISKFASENVKRFFEANSDATPDTLRPIVAKADDLIVIVAGGAGKHSCWLPTFGGSTLSVTKVIAKKDGTPVKSVKDFQL